MEPVSMPFMIAGVAAQHVNKTRVVESVVIGIIVGMVCWMGGKYIALPVIEEQVRQIKHEVQQMNNEMRQSMKEIKDYQNDRRSYRDQQQERIEAKIQNLQIEMAKLKK